jgi:hypothetical protein
VEIKAYQVKSVFTPMLLFCVRLCLEIDYNNPVVHHEFSSYYVVFGRSETIFSYLLLLYHTSTK